MRRKPKRKPNKNYKQALRIKKGAFLKTLNLDPNLDPTKEEMIQGCKDLRNNLLDKLRQVNNLLKRLEAEYTLCLQTEE